MSGFDLVDQLGRLAFGGYEVKPAAGDHERGGQAKYTVRDRVATVVVVKKPGIDITFAERSLNRGQVHGQTVIVNDGAGSHPVQQRFLDWMQRITVIESYRTEAGMVIMANGSRALTMRIR